MFVLREGRTRFLKSIFVLLSRGLCRARRRQRHWFVLCWFAGYASPRAVVPSIDDRLVYGEGAQLMLQLRSLPKLDTTFLSPLHLAGFVRRQGVAAEEFSALDDSLL